MKSVYVILRNLFFAGWILVQWTATLAQNGTALSFQKYIEIVKTNHPLAIQAGLQPQMGEASLKIAKGAFDPTIAGSYYQKQYDDKNYYQLLDAGLKIPTWVGIDFNAGFIRNEGVYLNASDATPSSGLVVAGLSIPLGQGLLMDKRRAEIQKAKIYLESSALEQQLLVNELIFNAGISYWQWYNSYYAAQLLEEMYTTAKLRFEAVKQSALLGDKPFIDTLEADIQVQNRLADLQTIRLSLENSLVLVNTYLWLEGSIPMEMTSDVFPEQVDVLQSDLDLGLIKDSIELMKSNHPVIQRSINKIEYEKVNLKLSREQLKPTVDLKYNLLNEPIDGNPIETMNTSNYTFGAYINFPLFLRKERGEVALSELKIQDMEADLDWKAAQIKFKIFAAINEFSTASEQVMLFNKIAEDSRNLLQAENRLFKGGESSLFMVNTREQSYVNAMMKQLAATTKQRETELKIKFQLGILN